jgi:dolichol-phosphate mannosyltransferase
VKARSRLVVVPTYNESESLPGTVERILDAVSDIDVLIVDDNSPDGTGRVADELARDSRVHVLHRPGKQGLGKAYLAGFRWAIERRYAVIVEMDADGSHQARELPRLLARLRNADLVLGSRYVAGGSVQNWPRSRLALSRLGNRYAQASLGLPLQDATGGYRVYRADVVECLLDHGIRSQGYCFQIDTAWLVHTLGYRIVEEPIAFVERDAGESKMSYSIVVEALWRITWWGLTRRRRVRVAKQVGRRSTPASQR